MTYKNSISTRPDLADLVRRDSVHRDLYTDPEIFDLEMERIFSTAWIYVAHTSQLPRYGDYVTAHVGRENLIILRGGDNEIRAFLNRCPHRGATLCADKAGSAEKGVVCPYHGWRFDAAGALKVVPQAENYDGALDLEKISLRQAANIAEYRGFLFVNLSENAGPLTDFLGHMRTSIDDLVDRSPEGAVECSPYVLRHYYRSNWKMSFENLNDTIHPGFAHAASVVAARAVAEDVGGPQNLAASLGMMMANGKPISFFQNSPMRTEAGGHSYIGGHMGADYSDITRDVYFERLAAAYGEERARNIVGMNRHLTLLYPSSTWHARYQTVRIVRPVRVDLTEVIGYVFKLKGAPEETFRNAIEYCNGANSAASPVISDDLEIYERCREGNFFGDEEWIPMSRGLNERFGDADTENLSPATSEAFIRNQFAAWRSYMAEEA
ncbi:MAG: Rieske 2Fe-2S domain-containing protein [Pseudomonadota bacterium]